MQDVAPQGKPQEGVFVCLWNKKLLAAVEKSLSTLMVCDGADTEWHKCQPGLEHQFHCGLGSKNLILQLSNSLG